jgi:flagellar secretion chaperone FliS
MKTKLDARQFYRDNAARGATPIELVVLLYDSAIEDMRRAFAAMQKSEVEARAAHVQHALMVLQQLQGTLDFDRGGGAARQFEQFYNVIRAKLLEAQIRNSPELMGEQIRFMSEVRECWVQAKRIVQPKSVPAPVPTENLGANSEWNA